jgi:hypothetical protein
MIAGLPLAFTAPFILLGLIALPLLWWLLRLVPPRPRRVAFPPTRILFEIEPKEETPARTPWWLTLLRLLLAALIIIAAAGPLWNPPPAGSRAGGPVALVIDSGWPAAAQWQERIAAAEAIVARAEADGVGVAVLASGAPPKETSLLRPGEAREALRLMAPVPHTPDRNDLLLPLGRLLAANPAISVVWLSDGADLGDGEKFSAALNQLAPGRTSVVTGGIPGAVALTAADNAAAGLSVKVLRAENSAPAQGVVRARDLRGLPIGDANFVFASGATETDARFDLPVEIRNDIARLEIAGERSAGAVTLLDKRWRRRTVGVVSGSTVDTAQPLLAGTFYLARALGPFADVNLAEGTSPASAVERFIDQRLPVIVLADVGTITETARNRLTRWIEEGGVLVRFAGPRLAAADDNLVPVRLRRGGRTLGGSLSWEQPQKLGSFSAEGPFNDLNVPGDVVVQRQVLAEPDGLLAERTWASLADGTPLVTATRRERGMIVLFHVTADTAWSNLPISGSFVDMLRRIVALAGSGTAAASGTPSTQAERGPAPTIAPSRLLDGFGAFTAPGPTAKPIPADFTGRAIADHPPGFYGPPEGLVAVNTLAPADRMTPLALGALQSSVEPYHQGESIDLRPGFLLGVFSLLALDAIVVFLLAGGISRLARRRATAATLALALAVSAFADHRPVRAQELTQAQIDFALQATLQTRFAYVRTGNAEADNLSQAGLEGLSIFMSQRTALETAEPMGVDISRDELSFFPILYWPVLPTSPVPDAATLARVDTYMKQGGSILFDTRDEFAAGTGRQSEVSPALARLREILAGLDIPELEPVPRDHVLTKSFYLLRDFPGRFTGGTLWVEAMPAATEEQEARPARAGDGVSQILITSNDFAGAWAVGRDGQPLLPLVPGEPRQREFAFRVGVNIVMYVLTGNYKADQVHVPALLERLGQ